MNIWEFASNSPWLAFFLALIVASVLKSPFWALNRFFRSRNIAKHGWPTAPIDADGDVVYPDKDEK